MRKNIVIVVGMMAFIIMAGCVTTPQESADVVAPVIVPAYNCQQAVGKIVLDGKLNEAAWKNAISIDKFYPFSPKDATVLSKTKARLTWDKDNLYIAIECEDNDIWSYSDKADDELWRGDVAEFFIKPSTSSLAYCEFVMAPGGALYDARYPSRGAGGFNRFKGWSSNTKVATTINGTDGNWKDTDTGYVIEAAIPFSALSDIVKKPAVGDVWTFGVCRYDYTKSYEHPLLLMTMPESKHNGYHYYEGYRQLVFKGK